MQFLSVIFVVIALVAALAESVNLIGTISVPSDSSHSAGVYWVGSDSIESRLVTDMPWLGNSDAEHLVTVVVPGSEMSESVKPGSAFTVRSADFTSRVSSVLVMMCGLHWLTSVVTPSVSATILSALFLIPSPSPFCPGALDLIHES